jgi:hypothetical protein
MGNFKPKPEDINRFLHYISQNETSGGKNLDHPIVRSGAQAGDAAEGMYGIMPNTKEEFVKRYPGDLNENSSNNDFARKIAEHVLERAGGDETLAAGLWNQGHNAKEDAFPRIKNTQYAKKYAEARKAIPEALDTNPYMSMQQDESMEDKINKASTVSFPSLINLLRKP